MIPAVASGHMNLILFAAKITMRSSNHPWLQRWMLVDPYMRAR